MKKSLLFFALTFFVCSLNALNPSRTYKQRPEKFNMEYSETKVKTNDGSAELNVWDFPCKSRKTTELMLIAHNGEGNMGDYLRRVDQLTSEFNVVIFDYRGFGESSEFEIDNNMFIYPHFQDDMETMFDYCRKQYVATFHVYGWGMGAGLALGIGFQRPETKSIIADSPFLSMEDLESRFEDWDEPMEVPFAGYLKSNEPMYSVENAPGKNLQKVKLIIGSNDILYNVADMKDLYSKSKKLIDKEIYVVENPDRKDNFKADKAGYFKVINDFLNTIK
jgi:pimeloyl-ACP methyl ester carboxylesterase